MRFLIGMLTLLGMLGLAAADVYTWVDDTGRTHYSDQPPADPAVVPDVQTLTAPAVTTIGNSGLRPAEQALLAQYREEAQVRAEQRLREREIAALEAARQPPAPAPDPVVTRIYIPEKREFYDSSRRHSLTILSDSSGNDLYQYDYSRDRKRHQRDHERDDRDRGDTHYHYHEHSQKPPEPQPPKYPIRAKGVTHGVPQTADPSLVPK